MTEGTRLQTFMHGLDEANCYKAGDILPSPDAAFNTHLSVKLWYDEGAQRNDIWLFMEHIRSIANNIPKINLSW